MIKESLGIVEPIIETLDSGVFILCFLTDLFAEAALLEATERHHDSSQVVHIDPDITSL
jgi:hypothetical protein